MNYAVATEGTANRQKSKDQHTGALLLPPPSRGAGETSLNTETPGSVLHVSQQAINSCRGGENLQAHQRHATRASGVTRVRQPVSNTSVLLICAGARSYRDVCRAAESTPAGSNTQGIMQGVSAADSVYHETMASAEGPSSHCAVKNHVAEMCNNC